MFVKPKTPAITTVGMEAYTINPPTRQTHSEELPKLPVESPL